MRGFGVFFARTHPKMLAASNCQVITQYTVLCGVFSDSKQKHTLKISKSTIYNKQKGFSMEFDTEIYFPCQLRVCQELKDKIS